ncbi:toprim domain-containing protein [Aminipila terrae]
MLVEGYMDVISLYQSGIRNVSASLGTALTENQAKILRRYTKNIVLSYDADNAGQAAALRGIDILFKEGCKPKVLHVTDGKDPDEFVKKHGKDAFKKLVDKSLGFVDYKISVLKKKYNLDSYEESIDFLKEAADILRNLSPIEADIHIKKLANEIKISENAIRLEINGNNTQEELMIHNHIENNKKEDKQINSSMLLVEKNLIKLMITDYEYFKIISQYEDAFKSDHGKKIFSITESLYKEDKELDIMKLQDGLEQDEMNMLADIIDNVQLADKEEQVLQECLNKIEVENLKEKENSLLMRLSMADEEENQETIKVLTEELMDLQRQKMERGK